MIQRDFFCRRQSYHIEPLDQRVWGGFRRFAFRAQPPHQPLSQHRLQRGRHQVVFEIYRPGVGEERGRVDHRRPAGLTPVRGGDDDRGQPPLGHGPVEALDLGLQEKFLVASRYASAVTKNTDQSLAEAYASVLRPRQNVYSRALEDFMTIPDVKLIDARNYQGRVGEKIVTRAIDDFRVTGVRVEIYASNGTLLEAGTAEQNINGIDWTYTATQANSLRTGSKIKAIATDVPGNEGTLEITL